MTIVTIDSENSHISEDRGQRMLGRLCACWLVLALVWTQTNSDEAEQPQQPHQPQQPQQPRNSSLPALSRSRRFLNLFSVIR